VFSVDRGRDEVLQAYNHKGEISQSTSFRWMDCNVSMPDILKKKKFQENKIIDR